VTPSGAARNVDVGLFGKLPARGDFVQLGLPGAFVRPWDDWLQRVMAASQDQMGEDWLPAFLESPVWRFALPGGLCGPGAVLGLFMPSVDRVGRYFPLTLAAVLPSGGWLPASDVTDPWLAAAEAAGRTALDEAAAPDEVMRHLPALDVGASGDMPGDTPGDTPAPGEWWTDGGPRVAETRVVLTALPDAARFAAMLGDGGALGEGAAAREEA
jgi:type VI secretion system protein ImpM